MTAQQLRVVTFDIPAPTDLDDDHIERVNASISFTYSTSYDIRTLSVNGAIPGEDVQGLLYVPELDASDPCVNITAPFLPTNVTRHHNLPSNSVNVVAIAPWVTPNCTQSYLAAGRYIMPRGFVFYLPDNGTTMPPAGDSIAWDLQDGGHWKADNTYPVYAVPGAVGAFLVEASAQYSGNLTDVPFGQTLATLYDQASYVRLFIDMSTAGSGGSLPSLWVFLLIVLGILLAIIGMTSILMHWVQVRRRQSLRRRIESGEVDLEILGIKRLTVPRRILDKLPLYTYGSGTPVSPDAVREVFSEEKVCVSAPSTRPSSPVPPVAQPTPTHLQAKVDHPSSSLHQPTCAICLDDFVPDSPSSSGTIVRELPCNHIFHPQCVDTFLHDNSSLCPICKRSVLPAGYCPRNVTNAMVRRERMLRRARERGIDEAAAQERRLQAGAPPRRFSTLGFHVRRPRPTSTFSTRGLQHQRRVESSPLPASQTPMVDLSVSRSNLPRSLSASSDPRDVSANMPPPPSAASGPAGRREWARQRAIAMLGRRAAVPQSLEDGEDGNVAGNEQRSAPRGRSRAWRKALRGVFPGFG